MAILDDLKLMKERFKNELGLCQSAQDVEKMRIKYLGRNGELTGHLRSLSSLPDGEKKETGIRTNHLKNEFNQKLSEEKKKFEKDKNKEQTQKTDVTLPGRSARQGSLHPLTQVMARINEIFLSMGFSIEEGQEIESEFYNFEALNIPRDHPSRDAFDTFYLEGGKYVLRSHTSNVQIHVMESCEPPIQVIMPGRVYRPDAVDASHSFMFHQVEGLMVEEDVKFSDLKGVLSGFCGSMFGKDIKTRVRPHFFPFTEPSVEVDISCVICRGKGCRVCKKSGWLEIMGAGMVNPKVFEAVGYDPEKYTAFAFGMGVERIAMLLYGIEDIRLFYENDIRFLKQFI
ncbi:MAG: phenylalanine--tRNA ligase subunit alpha [Candidatus Omnitrophota bacterium]